MASLRSRSTRAQKVQEYATIADEFARRGLAADEAGDYARAADAYRRALGVYDEGIREAAGVDSVAAVVERMRRQRANFGDRLGALDVALRAPPPRKAAGGGGGMARLFGGGKSKKEAAPSLDPQLESIRRGFESGAPAAVPPSDARDVAAASLRASRGGGGPRGALHRDPGGGGAAAAGATPTSPAFPRSGSSRGGGGSGAAALPRPGSAGNRGAGAAHSDLLRRHDKKLVEAVLNDVVNPESIGVRFSDVTGLEASKQHLYEAAVLPMARPDLFSGLRAPPRGVLLFGPPGNGKTMLAKAVASEGGATFFSISASSLVSKYLGDGEKMVRALFACAEELSPAVVFIDEVDSLLTARGEEHDAMRRLKTEVLVQMDGVTTQSARRVLVLAATNRPQDIDTACLRRFTKRVHIPLPDPAARDAHLRTMCAAGSGEVPFRLSDKDIKRVADRTDKYSFSDLTALVREAAMLPLRELGPRAISMEADRIRPVCAKDFAAALETVRPSANPRELRDLEGWAAEYGAAG